MSAGRPLVQAKTIVRYAARDWMHRVDSDMTDDPDAVWRALAAYCVHRVRVRAAVRFSFTDDAAAIERAERLLRALDKR